VIAYRHATETDAEAVLEFWSRAAEDSGRPADDADALRRLIDRDSQALELALDGDTLVGTLIAGFDGWRCGLYRLAVDPAHRGAGIARTLLEHAEARLRALGVTRVTAMVLDDNELGSAFWRASGFTPQSDWSRWVKSL